MISSRRTAAVTTAALLACLALAPNTAWAEKVGVAAAVNPDAYSSLRGAPEKQLTIGKSIFYNERISTDGSGVVQVLLVDGSTFTVGANSDLVIDKFVYDPGKQSGEIVATFSKGAMRFIGGKISKNADGVTVKTPAGSLAIRGGMFQGSLARGNSIFSFLYGEELTFTGNNGQTHTVYQPGYTLVLDGSTPTIRPTTPADIQSLMAALTNSNTNTAGVQLPGTPEPRQQLAETLSLQQLIADATATRIDDELFRQLLALQNQPPDEPNMPPILSRVGGYGSAFSLSEYAYDADFAVSTSPDDFTFNANTGTAILTLRDIDGNGSVSRGVFEFATRDNPASNLQRATLFDANGEALQTVETTGFMTVEPGAICSGCGFLEWGAFGATVSYFADPESPYARTDQIGPGWWVAADITAARDLPQMGNATYSGKAVGTVAVTGNPYYFTGRGDLDMSWNFAKRSGNLAITNFKLPPSAEYPALNVSGKMSMPGNINRFSGPLSGAVGQTAVTGGANGSFARRAGNPAAGVVGSWGVSSPGGYRATGIFGGSR